MLIINVIKIGVKVKNRCGSRCFGSRELPVFSKAVVGWAVPTIITPKFTP
jgi:hypothetical protein